MPAPLSTARSVVLKVPPKFTPSTLPELPLSNSTPVVLPSIAPPAMAAVPPEATAIVLTLDDNVLAVITVGEAAVPLWTTMAASALLEPAKFRMIKPEIWTPVAWTTKPGVLLAEGWRAGACPGATSIVMGGGNVDGGIGVCARVFDQDRVAAVGIGLTDSHLDARVGIGIGSRRTESSSAVARIDVPGGEQGALFEHLQSPLPAA